jgi:CxxC motif-containing protein (DUF1111 family)
VNGARTTALRTRHDVAALTLMVTLVAASCGTSRDPSAPPAVAASGGATTTFDATAAAFARSAANLDPDARTTFAVGNAFFRDNWVVAPSSTEGRDGLGPMFNATSCSGCHLHDGRAAPPTDGDDHPGLLVRLGPAAGGDPVYGTQLQDRAVPGVPAEGTVVIERTELPGTFADGTPYSLEQPTYRIMGALGPLAPDVTISARVAPAMIGMGLLEAVPDAGRWRPPWPARSV